MEGHTVHVLQRTNFYNLCLWGMNTKDVLGEFTIEFTSFYYYLHFPFCPPELLAISFLCWLTEYVVLDQTLEIKDIVLHHNGVVLKR